MSEFFRTQMGQRFYTSTMPAIADALTKIADQLEKGNELLTLLVVKNLDPPQNWTMEERQQTLSTVDRLKERLGLKKKP